MVTAWLMKNYLEYLSGKDVVIEKNTTLNEKYNILADMVIPSNTLPKLKYFGIGMGDMGTPVKMGYHETIDGTTFETLPFLCRRLENDLAPIERVKYRMRKEQSINGVTYAFYYLRTIDDNIDLINIKTIDKDASNSGVVGMFDTNNPAILNPAPKVLDPINPEKSKFYIIENNISFSFTQEEKNEIITAYRLLYSASDTPKITEICLYTGLDTTLPDNSLEAYVVRSAFFLALPYELQPLLTFTGVTQRYINIGGMRLY